MSMTNENTDPVQAPVRRTKKSRRMLRATTKEIPATEHYCAIAIVKVLRDLGGLDVEGNQYGPVGRDAILEGLSKMELKTKQSPTRILYYWKKYLITNGYIEKVAPGATVQAVSAAPAEAQSAATSSPDTAPSPA